ncbi:hypothetical protein PQO01_12850 [Lentisphaera marina]|jgi:predicted transcriptional regulator|uniref:hypothetical protein n=1 Tax=Lentisphaera marina TaxID=1111041 RepID=UPI0023657445|nr:hypothetical protein [Lentisphaera marina]MDD7985836.1 hypothetical protein [Lentisphaera marina]
MTAVNKSEILNAVQGLPEETSIEEAIERLYLVSKIKTGIQQAESGELLSHDEVKGKFSKWLE